MGYEFSELDSEILRLNHETVENLLDISTEKINVFSRDWTVQTIYDQILQGNIELNPKFQRRNAWDDKKRSLLIESLMLRLPVPEIVLAENHEEPNKFIVLDGRQRLMTLLGFINPTVGYWDKAKLTELDIKKSLNGKSYADFVADETLKDEKRAFENASIRCTVIFGQKTDDLLYQIFYRINSGTVPLSMQELRLALRKGYFSDFLIETTNELQPIHKVLGVDGPHDRLIDAELILKYLSFCFFGKDYKGDLKSFLDDTMKVLNSDREQYEKKVAESYASFNLAIENLAFIFEKEGNTGRFLQNDGKYSAFKAPLFEVQALYFALIPKEKLENGKATFLENYKELCKGDNDFIESFRSNTSSKKNYARRFKAFENLVEQSFQTGFNEKFIAYE